MNFAPLNLLQSFRMFFSAHGPLSISVRRRKLNFLVMSGCSNLFAFWGRRLFFSSPLLGMINRRLVFLLRFFLRCRYLYRLELNGLSYKAWKMRLRDKRTKVLLVDVGRSHFSVLTIPNDVKIRIRKWKSIRISGFNFESVRGITLALRFLRPPDPYKAKGVRFKNEIFNLKVGKKR